MTMISLSREKKDRAPKGGQKLLKEEQSQQSLHNRNSSQNPSNREMSLLGAESTNKIEPIAKYDAKTFKEWSSQQQTDAEHKPLAPISRLMHKARAEEVKDENRQ